MSTPPRQPFGFTIALTLQAPYLVHGNDPGRWGLDATLLRNAHGRPILPGTLIAGRVAEVWLNHGADLGQPSLDEWLGKMGNGQLAGDGGRRGSLRVADLELKQIDNTPWSPSAEQPLAQTRITLDDDTGSVQRGALLVIEQLAAPGTPLLFEGTWNTWATPDDARLLAQQLQAALRGQTQIGAYRSVGFGMLIQASVSPHSLGKAQEIRPELTKKLPPRTDKVRLQLQFSEHFCLTERLHNGNLFKGGDTIPGGAILGALAHTLRQAHGAKSVAELRDRSALARHFDALRCTHAHPAKNNAKARPIPIPYSWVSTQHGLRDAWGCRQSSLYQGRAPAFQLDWKASDFAQATGHTGWADVPRHLRVRTALQDGQARDEHLFAYECRYSPQGEDALCWLADFWLPPDITDQDRTELLQELQQLTQAGLAPLGKTDAVASVTWHAEGDVALTPAPQHYAQRIKEGELLALRLNSSALLLHAQALADKPIGSAADAYAQAFTDLMKQAGATGALSFSHHFARERLVGGTALQHRYRLGQEKPNSGAYQPLLITEAGSVFVFSVQRSQDVRKVLQIWEQTGLPLPEPVAKAHGYTWEDHPYIPANGYGEICLHTNHPEVPDLSAT